MSYPMPPSPVAPAQPRGKTLAIAALVTSILFCFGGVLPVIFALIVLFGSKRPDRGKGLAISALVITALWWIASVVGIAVLVTNDDFQQGFKDAFNEEMAVKVGQCFPKIPDDSIPVNTDAVPCSRPHSTEAYAAFTLPRGPYPRESDIERLADDGCSQRFETFVGRTSADSELYFFYTYPARMVWPLDREVMCFVTSDKKVTGTLKGTSL